MYFPTVPINLIDPLQPHKPTANAICTLPAFHCVNWLLDPRYSGWLNNQEPPNAPMTHRQKGGGTLERSHQTF